MQKRSLDALGREQLAAAKLAASARASTTVFGGHEHRLRQTVIALREGARLDEHENPGEATLLVLSGRIELSADGEVWAGRTGDFIVIPDSRHAVRAVEDCVMLLTAVPREHLRG
jgi:quercetin dioxygenase-like cupin family protein